MSQRLIQDKNLFIDSGAFSAWNNNTIIDLDAYIVFCLENIDYIDLIANLDVIPGAPYQKLTNDDIANSAKQGWLNYKKMLKAGIPKEKLIHIFHQGENFKWLKRLSSYADYIGLSPANDKTTAQKRDWLDKCMKYVTNSKGAPTVKFHGFAVTSIELMHRYPWYSVDSASWAATSRMGGILIPRFIKNKWDYTKNPWTVGVTLRSPHRNDKLKHFNNLSPNIKKQALSYIEEKGYKIGKSELINVDSDYKPKQSKEFWYKKHSVIERITEPGLSNCHKMRNEINILFFQNIVKQIPEWPTHLFKKKKNKGFFV